MNIPAFLRDADMTLLDTLGACKTNEELDSALTEAGVEHSASDLAPLFAALTPLRSPSATTDVFNNFSSQDFEKVASSLSAMMNSAQGKSDSSEGAMPGGIDRESINNLLSFLSNNKEGK